jgi:hypothetical protein
MTGIHHPTQLLVEMESCKIFALSGLGTASSLSQLPKQIGLQTESQASDMNVYFMQHKKSDARTL